MKTIKNKTSIKVTRIACLLLASIFILLLTGCNRKISHVKSQGSSTQGKITEGKTEEAKIDTGTVQTGKPNEGNINEVKVNEAKVNDSEVKLSSNFKLYFSDDQALYLIPEDRVIDKSDAKKVLEELIKGPKNHELSTVLPDKIVVKSISIKDKIATVDFDDSITNSIAGSTGESMALYGMANTLILNKQLGISKINLTVNNVPIQSLGGHILLKEPIKANLDLIKK